MLRTYRGYEQDLELGEITLLQALYYWTDLASKGQVTSIRGYPKMIRKWWPEVEWLPEGESFKVWNTNPTYWHCQEDYFEYVNQCFQGLLGFGDFIRGYIAEQDEEKAQKELNKGISKYEKQKQERIRWTALKEAGNSYREIAESEGVSHETVRQRCQENLSKTEKVDKPKRDSNARTLYINQDPETAAQKLREKFGSDFAKQLKRAL